ncbi:MAG: hypothetical protein Kow0047_28160 [Anaerolineae bacterium]
MEAPIVACAQQRFRLHATVDDYRRDCARFLRMAQSKGASLVVLPELSGLMLVAPRMPGLRASLLRQADQGRQPGASLWKRVKARMAGSTAEILRVDFRGQVQRYLSEHGAELRQEAAQLYAELARSYGLYLIVGAGLLPSQGPGLKSVAMAFSPQGHFIGEAARVSSMPGDDGLVTQAEEWQILETPVGRIGILMGADILYPEVGRLLAFKGADLLVSLTATSDTALAARIHAAALARAQENQIFVVTSYLIGPNLLLGEGHTFTGRSAILAPVELTERYTGVRVQIGAAVAEGLMTSELDYRSLQQLWTEQSLSPRGGRPLSLAGKALAAGYALGRTVDEAWQDAEAARAEPLLLPQPEVDAVPVSELPVVAVDEREEPPASKEDAATTLVEWSEEEANQETPERGEEAGSSDEDLEASSAQDEDTDEEQGTH